MWTASVSGSIVTARSRTPSALYHGLTERLDGYPVLNEADYSSREYEAALENIEDAATCMHLLREVDHSVGPFDMIVSADPSAHRAVRSRGA